MTEKNNVDSQTMRTSKYTRKTKETEITAFVNLDGTGEAEIHTGIKFLDHMLTCLATHSFIDIDIKAKGDLKHHVVEDTALVLGEALLKAIKQDERITRFANCTIPMDESLVSCSIDLGGRPYHVIELMLKDSLIEDLTNADLTHFMRTLATSLRANLHLHVHYGDNDHHKVEAAFKALARSLKNATEIDLRRIDSPSTKGVL